MQYNLITVLVVSLGFACSSQNSDKNTSATAPAIYGEDNRYEWYDSRVSEPLRQAAKSTFAMIAKSNILSSSQSSAVNLKPRTFKDAYDLCDSEPFAQQPALGACSAFLVTPTRLATAGHCVKTQADCDSHAFVVDYLYESPNNPLALTTSDIYSCKKLVQRKQDNQGADYAIIELDRPVTDRQPLTLNTSSVNNAELAVIGYPAGIPLKVATNAYVRSSSHPDYFVTNADVYGGNSGSAVINTSTGRVEGILVRGISDFTEQNGCKVSRRCLDNSCAGEEVTKASTFASLINAEPAPSSSSNSSSITSQLSRAAVILGLLQGVNSRFVNCSLSYVASSLLSTGNNDEYIFDLKVDYNDGKESETKQMTIDFQSPKSLISTILGSILSGSFSQCILR